jgi:hypothetical protein
MRTTINLDDAALESAIAYANAGAIKLGQAISELIVRGSAGNIPLRDVNGFWVFDLPKNTPKITAARVRQLLDESH